MDLFVFKELCLQTIVLQTLQTLISVFFSNGIIHF